MKEFIILIYAKGNPILNLPLEKQQNHIKKVGEFIRSLVEMEKLKNAQPFEPKGITITGENGNFVETPLNADKGDIAGYYHILAEDTEEAVSICKSDPRFEDAAWKIEIRTVLNIEGIS